MSETNSNPSIIKELHVAGGAYQFNATQVGGTDAAQIATHDWVSQQINSYAVSALEYKGALPDLMTPATAQQGNVYVLPEGGLLDAKYPCDAGDLLICKVGYDLKYEDYDLHNYWDIVQGDIDLNMLDAKYDPKNHKHTFSGGTQDASSGFDWSTPSIDYTITHTHDLDLELKADQQLGHDASFNLPVEVEYEKASLSSGTPAQIGATVLTNTATADESNYTPDGGIGDAGKHSHEIKFISEDGSLSASGAAQEVTLTGSIDSTGKVSIPTSTKDHGHGVNVTEQPAAALTSAGLSAVFDSESSILSLGITTDAKDFLYGVNVEVNPATVDLQSEEKEINVQGDYNFSHGHGVTATITDLSSLITSEVADHNHTFTGAPTKFTVSVDVPTYSLGFTTTTAYGAVTDAGKITVEPHTVEELQKAFSLTGTGVQSNTGDKITVNIADFGLGLTAHSHTFKGTTEIGALIENN